jgi:hypothetical protein
MTWTYIAVAFVFSYLFSRAFIGQEDATDTNLFWAVFVPILLGFAIDSVVILIRTVVYVWNL